ncbi:MAG: efflux RND transporter periplasmic adaptor subunit [Bacillota bacterium]
MRKITAILTTVVIIGLIVFILLGNKAKMEEKVRAYSFTSYPVSVAKVSRQELSSNLTQVGVIGANKDVAVVSETQGKTLAVFTKVGSYVAAGDPIIKVDNELQKAKYLAAETNFEKNEKDFERYTALHKDGLISDSVYEAARLAYKAAESDYIAAKRQYNNSIVTAPISGIITSLPVDIGTMVNQGTVVANVVDISKLKVKLNIAEEDAFRLREGDPVTVETSVYPGIQFPGVIESISVKGDEAHTYPVEIAVPNNKDHPLKAGMFGKVTFNTGAGKNALAIPREALVGSIKDPQVYVVEKGIAKLRDIVVDSEYGTDLAVLQGLKEGEEVVINGQINLKENVKVTVVK